MPKVLIVDDEPVVRAVLTDVLRVEGFEVVAAASGLAALDEVTSDTFSIAILDMRMPGLDGMETLPKLKGLAPKLPVIMLTGYGSIPSAVEAMRLGASDYLTKPVQPEKIALAVRRALEYREFGAEVEGLRHHLRERGALLWLIGPSPEIQRVIQQVGQVAESSLTILIQGETGTGKELVARAIHQLSARREKPFVALDCGAIPDTLIESELFGYERGAFTGADRRREGHFELAEGGSLFLDEIVNLPLTTQSKLLRVLQERQVQILGGRRAVPVDVRIIAASNVPLEREMRAGRFRQDLYYRLNEFVIRVPPLRERRDDIVDLAKRFLADASMELRRPVRGISDEAAQILLSYSWPGNVRELRNVIRRAVLLSSDEISPEHLMALPVEGAVAPSTGAGGPVPAGLSLKQFADTAAAEAERQAIRRTLQATRGNKSEAARILRTDYKTLHLKMKRYGIHAREFLAS
jgi:DNA-binding NtrC family response regulator